MCQIEINLSEDLIYWSDEAFLILNLDSENPLITGTDKLKGIIHPKDKFAVLSAFVKALPSKRDLDLDFRILNNEKNVLNVRCIATFSTNIRKNIWLRCLIFPVEMHSPPVNILFYKNLIENLPFSVCLIHSARVINANNACLSMLGYQSNQEVYHLSVLDFQPPLSKKKHFRHYILRTKKPEEFLPRFMLSS